MLSHHVDLAIKILSTIVISRKFAHFQHFSSQLTIYCILLYLQDKKDNEIGDLRTRAENSTKTEDEKVDYWLVRFRFNSKSPETQAVNSWIV